MALIRRITRNKHGQATVEMVVAFPIMLCLVCAVFNVMVFLNIACEFDAVSANAVRIYASSVETDITLDDTTGTIARSITETLDNDAVKVSVVARKTSAGFSRYDMVLSYAPTFFGMKINENVLGISLPTLKHKASMTIDTYTGSVI